MRPDEIARIRERLRLTQQELADLLGVNRVAIARWETGARNISEPAARLLRRIHEERAGRQRKTARIRDGKSGRKRRS